MSEKLVSTELQAFRHILNNIQIDPDFEASADLLNGALRDLSLIVDKVSNVYSGLLPVQYELRYHKDWEDNTIDYLAIGMKGDEFVESDVKNAFHIVDVEMKRYKGSSRIFYRKAEITKKQNVTGFLLFELDN